MISGNGFNVAKTGWDAEEFKRAHNGNWTSNGYFHQPAIPAIFDPQTPFDGRMVVNDVNEAAKALNNNASALVTRDKPPQSVTEVRTKLMALLDGMHVKDSALITAAKTRVTEAAEIDIPRDVHRISIAVSADHGTVKKLFIRFAFRREPLTDRDFTNAPTIIGYDGIAIAKLMEQMWDDKTKLEPTFIDGQDITGKPILDNVYLYGIPQDDTTSMIYWVCFEGEAAKSGSESTVRHIHFIDELWKILNAIFPEIDNRLLNVPPDILQRPSLSEGILAPFTANRLRIHIADIIADAGLDTYIIAHPGRPASGTMSNSETLIYENIGRGRRIMSALRQKVADIIEKARPKRQNLPGFENVSAVFAGVNPNPQGLFLQFVSKNRDIATYLGLSLDAKFVRINWNDYTPHGVHVDGSLRGLRRQFPQIARTVFPWVEHSFVGGIKDFEKFTLQSRKVTQGETLTGSFPMSGATTTLAMIAGGISAIVPRIIL